MNIAYRWGLIVLAGLSTFRIVESVAAQEPVRIALRAGIISDAKVVTLGDLSDMQGGDAVRRRAMSSLDFDAVSPKQASVISLETARARLLIAGYKPGDFQLTGYPEVRIEPPGSVPPVADEMALAIRQHVAAGLGVPLDDVDVKLVSIPEGMARPEMNDVPHRFEPLDHSDQLPGRKSVVLGVFEGDEMIERIRVLAETSVLREMLVARQPIDRGEMLDDGNCLLERRRVESSGPDHWLAADALGKTAVRRIQARQVIRPFDVASEKVDQNPVLVKPRDRVWVFAGTDQFQISLAGMEVLKAGRAGDLIPLRNPETRKVIYGRVVDSKRVEVSF